MEATKSDCFVDHSLESSYLCNTYLTEVISLIKTLKLELEAVKKVSKYTAEIKHKISLIEQEIEDLELRKQEAEKMQEFLPGSWVRNGTTRPGKVINLVIAGKIPEVHVLWSGNTVPVPERPFQLKLLQPGDLEYIWNGDRFPKLVRRIDGHECDEIEILQDSLLKLEGHLGEDDCLKEQTYLRKRISYCNQQDLERLERVVRQGLEIFYRVGEALAEIRDRKLYKDLGYSNFRDYLMERWNMKKSRAYQLIDSCEVIENISHGGQKLSTAKSVHHGGQNEPIAYQSTDIESDLVISENVHHGGQKTSPDKSVHHGGQNEPIAYQRDNEPSEIVIPKSERVAREVGKAPKELQPEVWKETVKRFGNDPTAKQVKEVVADLKSDNYPDKQSTVQTSCPDKPLITGNQKLAHKFEIGQLVKLKLANFHGASENLKLANHSYGEITALTETGCSFNVSVFGHKSFVVSPQDLEPVDSVRFCVDFSPKQFIKLMSIHQTRDGIEDAIKKGVLGN